MSPAGGKSRHYCLGDGSEMKGGGLLARNSTEMAGHRTWRQCFLMHLRLWLLPNDLVSETFWKLSLQPWTLMRSLGTIPEEKSLAKIKISACYAEQQRKYYENTFLWTSSVKGKFSAAAKRRRLTFWVETPSPNLANPDILAEITAFTRPAGPDLVQ